MNTKLQPKALWKDGAVVVTRARGGVVDWIMRDYPHGGWGKESL